MKTVREILRGKLQSAKEDIVALESVLVLLKDSEILGFLLNEEVTNCTVYEPGDLTLNCAIGVNPGLGSKLLTVSGRESLEKRLICGDLFSVTLKLDGLALDYDRHTRVPCKTKRYCVTKVIEICGAPNPLSYEKVELLEEEADATRG